MKYFKMTIMVLFLTMITLTSCKDELVEVPQNTNESLAVKSAMKALKSHFNADGSLNRDGNNPTNNIIFDFCFDFIYPVTLSYNTGTEVVVQDLDGLIDILINMNDNLYISGIAFPFQVEIFNHNTGSFEIITVQDEASFMEIINDCSIDDDGNQTDDCNCTNDYQPVCISVQNPNGESFIIEFPNFCLAECEGFTQNDVVDCDYSNPSAGNIFGDCFDFVYPISVIYYDYFSNPVNQGTTVSVNNDEELEIIFYTNYRVEFVYPFNVQIEDNGQQTIQTITSDNDFYDLIEDCNENNQDCNCPTVIDPVCIATPNGGQIIQYDNECLAMCDGFTPNDFVDCNPTGNDCEISNVTVQIGDCISETAYSITIDFDVVNPTSNDFVIVFGNGEVRDGFNLSQLPISLDVDINATGTDDLQVMFENSNCIGYANWIAPDCGNNNGGDCEISNVSVQVNDCVSQSSYSITLDFNVTNAATDEFTIELQDGTTFGPFSTNTLPLNIEVNNTGNGTNSMIINMVNSNCENDILWNEPDCSTSNNDCWSFIYPLIINVRGDEITVNSDTEFNAVFNPSDSMLVYPFDVMVNNASITINTPNDFYEIGEFDNRCD